MSPALLLHLPEDTDGQVTDEEFELDFRVVESVLPGTAMMCDSSDGCGSTCSGSACNSSANEPS